MPKVYGSIHPGLQVVSEVIQSIDAEIARLEKVRALLNGHVSTPTLTWDRGTLGAWLPTQREAHPCAALLDGR